MIHMPKGSKVLLSHKEKLEKAASSLKLSEEFSAVIQKGVYQKERDPGSFTHLCLIEPLAVKNALAYLEASINLMPYFLFRKLGISELKTTKMSIQFTDLSLKYAIGFYENLLVKSHKFIFLVDFVVEIDKDELVLIILGCPFLETAHAVIDVHDGRMSLRVGKETVTFNIRKSIRGKQPHSDYLCYADQTLKFIHDQWMDIVHLDGKWIETDQNHEKAQEPPKLELKELLEHLKYAFLQGDDQLPVVISSSLFKDEKFKLPNVLRNHKGVITWSIADIKGIDSSFYTHKILMEDEYKPTVQPQRRVNLNIKEVVKKEVIKLLEAKLIYPISDSPWILKILLILKIWARSGFNTLSEVHAVSLRITSSVRVKMPFKNFIYTEDDDDLAFLPKEPSPGFEVIADSGESPKADVYVVHPGSVAAHIKERKCKTRRGYSRPPVKRKLASESSSSRVVHAKNSTSKDDASILSISDDDEVNRRAREFLQVIEKMRGEADAIKARERSHKEECYQVTLSTLGSNIDSLEAKKARLEAVEASLHMEVKELKQDRRDVVSKVATMKEPFDLSKGKGYCSLYKKEHTQASNDFSTATFSWLDEFVADAAAPIKALLSKKPPVLQKPAPSRTQVPVPSS
uniref:Reverse transcriptase domain-containing protein n=1 Tax=Tanacetum cinerariifolium TaxID=118510 RepID=A0A699GQN0_TANCI|nr:hypothetical protein [Tanacetum cinerariifolium]